MIFAIPLLVSCALSIWFCYWITGAFSGLRSRPCRITFFATPLTISVLFLCFSDAILIPLYHDIPLPVFFGWLGGATGEFIIALAIFETVFALLITVLVNELSKVHARSVLRHK